MAEIWVPVLGYEGFYEASSEGNVRRIHRYGRAHVHLLRPGSRRDYANFTLCLESQAKTFCAHRLVWEAFNGQIPAGMQINHKNGDKRDNRLSNLEICTPSENTLHAVHVLHRPWTKPPHVPGTKNGRAKINEEAVQEIRRLRQLGWSQQKIADAFGIHQTGVSALLRGLTWKHL